MIGQLVEHALEDAALVRTRNAVDIRGGYLEMLKNSTKNRRFSSSRWPVKEQGQANLYLQEQHIEHMR